MLSNMAGSSRSSQAITLGAATLGAAIKDVREGLGWTQRQLAAAIGRENDSSILSRWESGSRKPKPEDIAQVIKALGLEGERATNLTELAASTDEPRWLAVTVPERRQQLAALLNVEHTATLVTHVAPNLVPGVLQTNEVIRSIMLEADVPASEIDERVIVRIGRRNLYTRDNPAHMVVFLGEAAIRQVIGGRKIWVAQLRYLLDLAELPNIDLRVVPYSAGWSQLLSGAFILIDSDHVPSIVSLDLHSSGLMLQASEDISTYRRHAEAVREKAMSPADTARLIAEVITQLEIQDDNTP